MPDLFYRERGQGIPLILLHGFPFQQNIWDNFADKLAKHFHVFTVDLPGFGKSKLTKTSFTLDDIGKEVLQWIEEKNLADIILIGHSLGGYVALNIIGRKEILFSGLGLFHSTAYPDSEEKKKSRNKVIEFIDKNGVEAFTSNFITPLFANPGNPAIQKVKGIAVQASTETVRGYTLAMRDRDDRTDVLKSFAKPVLFLAGEKDPGISVESIYRQAAVCAHPQIKILPNTAHMGMFENEKQCLEIIESFILEKRVT